MYEEMVKALRNCGYPNSFHYCKECIFVGKYGGSCDLKKLLPAAADAIESLDDIAQTYAETVQELKMKSQWIPVTERLPEEMINPNTADFEPVLCATIWGDVRAFSYGTPFGHKDAHFWNGNGIMDKYVTHWMPLPEPPKEETC